MHVWFIADVLCSHSKLAYKRAFKILGVMLSYLCQLGREYYFWLKFACGKKPKNLMPCNPHIQPRASAYAHSTHAKILTSADQRTFGKHSMTFFTKCSPIPLNIRPPQLKNWFVRLISRAVSRSSCLFRFLCLSLSLVFSLASSPFLSLSFVSSRVPSLSVPLSKLFCLQVSLNERVMSNVSISFFSFFRIGETS